MLRKGSELMRDREVLLDLDYGGEAQATDSYGSLQNGGFIPPRYLSAAAGDEDDDDDPICIHCDPPSKQPLLGNYFRDGKTKIDFVLVWEVRSRRKRRGKGKGRTELTNEEGDTAAAEEASRSERRKALLAQWRDKFVQNLQNAGLVMEKEETANEKKTVHFLKLSAPWDVLVYYAEELSLRAPLQAQPTPDFNTSARVLKRLCIPNIMAESVPNRPLDYYTCAFRRSKMNRFLGCDNHETYFTNTQRHRIVFEILARTLYGKRKRAEVGVARLLNDGAYTAAFPLHEGPFQLPEYEVCPDELNQRQVLFHYWARWSKWYKYQPLDHIREYFGEKIALYFAWLGFYTAWLLPAAVVGTLVFVAGVMSMGTNTPAKEICESGASYLMCPLCNTCQPWNMSDICPMAKIGYLFDHPGTVVFSVFMSFWAVTFLEYWKRKMATLAHHWDCMDFHEEEERPRPEFAAMAPAMEQNPVTGVKEPYFPEKARLSRMLTGSMVIVIMLCVVMIFLVTVIMYRGIISVMMFHTGSPVLRTQAGNIANISSSVVNLGLILLMGQVYTALAEQLTKWEMHRTQTEYEDAFTFKVFIFQFVNFYSSPFYVAFFKGRFVGYPTNYGTLFGMRNEDCGSGGCLIELAEQLFIIMVGKQLISNVQEFIIPKVKAWRQKRAMDKVRGGKASHEPRRWEEDYQLVQCEGLFEEYLEMVLQFGFITIFVAAFPLAPLFALLNNWVEVRLDAHKFVCEYRRPVAERVQNIGVWFNILEALSHMSVIANAFLIAFTSDFLPRLLYQYKFDYDLRGYVNFTLAYAPVNYTVHPMCRYKAFRDDSGNYTLIYWELLAVRLGFIIAFEHVVFFVLRAIDWMVPDIPESLELKIKRERYLAKQALAENQEALLVSRGRGATPGVSSAAPMRSAMFPGYGFSPLPDFQPHLHAFRCKGESPSMWIPGSGESQALNEARDDRPLLRPCHHKHVAVCQQETLAFIELKPPVTPKLNGFGSAPPTVSPDTHSLALNGFKHTLNELNEFQNGCHRSDTDNGHETNLNLDTHMLLGENELKCQNGIDSDTSLQDKPRAVTTLCRPLHAALSLPLSFPLSSLYTDRDSWDSQPPCSPSSPEGPGFQSPDPCQPQRRTSQGSLKEKSIRRKMRVYSPDSTSDESLSSPILDGDYIFPGPFASFLEEDIGLSSLDAVTSPLSVEGATDLANLNHLETLQLPAEPLQIIEDSIPGLGDDSGTLETSSATGGGSSASRCRQGDNERRRFSASELISRLQLSQRKNSFTLKLGKSLSARVATRDRQSSSSLSPNPDHKSNSKHRSSGGSSDSAPQSPVGPPPPLPANDNGTQLHRWSTKLGTPLPNRMRKKSIEEDWGTPPTVTSSNRLSRFLPSSILYQEYSDVAINREIQRQQGKEPGTEEEGLRDEGSDGTPSPSNLSPSSSFRSSRGSAFALWQDIPDVRSSGQLDNFSNEERKLQEAKFELVTSEASYIRSLTIAVDHFMLSQELGDCLGAQDKQWLFSKLPEVKDVSERFLQDLEHRLEEDILRFDVCDIVLDHCPALRRVYLPYVTNQAYQEQTYQRLLHENARFPSILARLEEDPICQRLPLTSFLILPFQRITRLKMLVENILKRTTPGSRDEDTATKAFNELKKIIKECNSSVQSMKRMEELIHLNKKIHFEGKIFPLISQSRWLVKHGELLEVDTQTMSISGSKLKLPTKPVYLHLFNDCLLLSRRKDTWKFMVFVHAKIGELKVKDLSQKLQGISGFIFHLQLCEGQQLKHQILLKAHTESGKQRWITAMFPSDPLEDIEQASENDDVSQVQCIKSYQAQEHDELTLEKADILQAKTITSDGWVEGIRLSDGERGWFPKTYVEEITSRSARLRNLRENIRIKCVTQKLEGEH